MENNKNIQKSQMIIYTTEDGLAKIETTFDEDTVWLSIDQMAELFQRDRSVIGKHVRNVFKEGELVKESVWAKFAYTAADGKVYDVDFYNLDVIISVGYRVKSKRGTQFRICWKESESFVLLRRYSTDRFWKSMLRVLTMIQKQKFPSSFLKRFKIKFIMQFMDRQRLRLFIQERTQKKISWVLPHLLESNRH